MQRVSPSFGWMNCLTASRNSVILMSECHLLVCSVNEGFSVFLDSLWNIMRNRVWLCYNLLTYSYTFKVLERSIHQLSEIPIIQEVILGYNELNPRSGKCSSTFSEGRKTSTLNIYALGTLISVWSLLYYIKHVKMHPHLLLNINDFHQIKTWIFKIVLL